jgi:hypothetical protein
MGGSYLVDYEVMVKKKRMAGIAIIVVGLIMGLLAYILDLVTTGKIHSSSTPLYLLLGGLMISVLGAIYIGAGSTEAIRLLNKQVRIMKTELSEKEKTIDEQKKGLETLSDNRLTNLSPTVDRLDMLEKEKAAEAAAKPPEKPAEAAPAKQAWEKKLDAKRTEKTADLPPPPPKSMVVPGPAKPAASQALPPPPPGLAKGQALPPPPPKSMQVAPPSKPHEPTVPPGPVLAPKPVVAPVPVPVPKPVAPVIAVVEPKPAPVAPVNPQVQPTPEPAPVIVPQPPEKEDEDAEEEGEEEEVDEDDLLPTTTCPKCSNTFKGDWEHCPFCDFNLKAPKEVAPVAEPHQAEPAPAANAGLSILGYSPKKTAPAPVVTSSPPPEPTKIPTVPMIERFTEPPRPVEAKPATSSIIPPLPDFSRSTTSVPPPPPVAEVPRPVVTAPAAEAPKDRCPSCNKTVKPHWKNCPYCKAMLK